MCPGRRTRGRRFPASHRRNDVHFVLDWHQATHLDHDQPVDEAPLTFPALEAVDIATAREDTPPGPADHSPVQPDVRGFRSSRVASQIDGLRRDMAARHLHTRQSGFDLVPRGRGPRKDRPMMIVDHLGVVHGGQERLVTAVDGTGIAGDRAADLLLVEKSQEPRIDVVGTPCRGFHPRFPVDTCRRTRLSSPSVGPSSRGAPRV